MLPSLLWIFLWSSIRVVFLWVCHPLKSSSIEVVFNGGCIPLSSSSIEVIFQWGFLPLMTCSISSVSTFPWSFSMGLAELCKNSHEFKLKKKENHRKEDLKKSRPYEEGITEIYPQCKLALQKRRPFKKTGRRFYWNMTIACLANQSWTELGPAQPKLVR